MTTATDHGVAAAAVVVVVVVVVVVMHPTRKTNHSDETILRRAYESTEEVDESD